MRKEEILMNFVSLVGRLHQCYDEKTRCLEVTRPESVDNADNLMIPCRYWTLDGNNYLTSLKEGSLLALRGRIDCDDKIGMYVVVEQITLVK